MRTPEVGVALDVIPMSQEEGHRRTRVQGTLAEAIRGQIWAADFENGGDARPQSIGISRTRWEYLGPGQGHHLGDF